MLTARGVLDCSLPHLQFV